MSTSLDVCAGVLYVYLPVDEQPVIMLDSVWGLCLHLRTLEAQGQGNI